MNAISSRPRNGTRAKRDAEMFMFLGRDVTRAAGPSARRPRVPGGVDLAVLVGAHERARGGRRGAAGGCVHAGGRRLTAAAAPAPRQPRASPVPSIGPRLRPPLTSSPTLTASGFGGSPPRMSRVGTSLGSELTGPSGVRTVCSSRVYHDSALAASPSELTDTIKLYIKLCVLLL